MITIIFSALFVILGTLITIIIACFGTPGFLMEFSTIYAEFMKYISFGYRYLYFLFGNFTKTFLDALVTFFILKLVVLPIISTLRSVIAHGGS